MQAHLGYWIGIVGRDYYPLGWCRLGWHDSCYARTQARDILFSGEGDRPRLSRSGIRLKYISCEWLDIRPAAHIMTSYAAELGVAQLEVYMKWYEIVLWMAGTMVLLNLAMV